MARSLGSRVWKFSPALLKAEKVWRISLSRSVKIIACPRHRIPQAGPAPRQALWFTQSPTQLVPEVLSSGIKRLRDKTGHSSSPAAVVKKAYSSAFTPVCLYGLVFRQAHEPYRVTILWRSAGCGKMHGVNRTSVLHAPINGPLLLYCDLIGRQEFLILVE
jgi:hypothetical protein